MIDLHRALSARREGRRSSKDQTARVKDDESKGNTPFPTSHTPEPKRPARRGQVHCRNAPSYNPAQYADWATRSVGGFLVILWLHKSRFSVGLSDKDEQGSILGLPAVKAGRSRGAVCMRSGRRPWEIKSQREKARMTKQRERCPFRTASAKGRSHNGALFKFIIDA